jgi:hypothetical protein
LQHDRFTPQKQTCRARLVMSLKGHGSSRGLSFDPSDWRRDDQAQSTASDPRHTKIGHEELLALVVTRDRVLALSRSQPIDEGLTQVRLHMRVLLGVHQYQSYWLNSRVSP